MEEYIDELWKSGQVNIDMFGELIIYLFNAVGY